MRSGDANKHTYGHIDGHTCGHVNVDSDEHGDSDTDKYRNLDAHEHAYRVGNSNGDCNACPESVFCVEPG